MKQIKGFKNSYILTEEGIKKTNLIIKNGIILSIGDQTIDGYKYYFLEDGKMFKGFS